jgi:alpha-glucosidase
MTMLLTYPGVPSIFAGDEIGLEGAWGEDSRRTINWEDRSGWDLDFYNSTKVLIQLRKDSHALIHGGLRWVVVEKDYLAYLRESKSQTLLIFISRSPVKTEIDLSDYGYTVAQTLYGESAKGTKIKIDSTSATQGIWLLTQ